MDRSFRLVHWLSITLFLRKTSQESINLEWKSYLDCFLFLGSALYAGRIWKGDIEELETMGRIRNLLKKRLNAKEVIFPTEIRNFIFPVEDGRINFSGRDQELRTPTLIREHTIRGESQRDFLGEAEVSLPPLQDMIFGPCQETSCSAITLNPESNFTRREKNHSLFHWNTLTSPELLIQTWMFCKETRIDDYWNIDGSRDLSDSWTGFTQFALLSEKPPEGQMWSGWRLTKRQATSRPDHLRPELWRGLARNAKLREKHWWAIEKPKLDNARRLWGICFIDPEDMEFKETIKNAIRKLETPVVPAMPCKTCKKNKHGGDP